MIESKLIVWKKESWNHSYLHRASSPIVKNFILGWFFFRLFRIILTCGQCILNFCNFNKLYSQLCRCFVISWNKLIFYISDNSPHEIRASLVTTKAPRSSRKHITHRSLSRQSKIFLLIFRFIILYYAKIDENNFKFQFRWMWWRRSTSWKISFISRFVDNLCDKWTNLRTSTLHASTFLSKWS